MQRLIRLLISVIIGLSVLGCSWSNQPHEPARTWPPDGALAVKLPLGSDLAAIVRENGRLWLLVGPAAGPVTARTSFPDKPGKTGTATVYLATAGGTDPGAYPTFVFGNAPPGASAFYLNLQGSLVGFNQGVFLAAAPEEDVLPDSFTWSFTSPAGPIILSGLGIRS